MKRETRAVKVYIETLEYIKKFCDPFEDTIADALEKALNLNRSSDRKGKKNDDSRPKKNVRSTRG